MNMPPWTLLILAKQPKCGFSKTRLCPPLTLDAAAAVAEAALRDTLDAAAGSGAAQVMVALAGDPRYLADESKCVVFEQRGRDLNERLENAWARTTGWVVQIGSDTPQLSAADLDQLAAALADNDAVLGPAEDGGWWALAQREHRPGLFDSVVMSSPTTFDAQLAAVKTRHERVAVAKTLRDLDYWADAIEIAREHPALRTSVLVHKLA